MKRKTEREKFEEWMKRYWAGVSLDVVAEYDDEYKETAAQTAWEVWKRQAARERKR